MSLATLVDDVEDAILRLEIRLDAGELPPHTASLLAGALERALETLLPVVETIERTAPLPKRTASTTTPAAPRGTAAQEARAELELEYAGGDDDDDDG